MQTNFSFFSLFDPPSHQSSANNSPVTPTKTIETLPRQIAPQIIKESFSFFHHSYYEIPTATLTVPQKFENYALFDSKFPAKW